MQDAPIRRMAGKMFGGSAAFGFDSPANLTLSRENHLVAGGVERKRKLWTKTPTLKTVPASDRKAIDRWLSRNAFGCLADAVQRNQAFEKLEERFPHHFGVVLLYVPFPEIDAVRRNRHVVGKKQV